MDVPPISKQALCTFFLDHTGERAMSVTYPVTSDSVAGHTTQSLLGSVESNLNYPCFQIYVSMRGVTMGAPATDSRVKCLVMLILADLRRQGYFRAFGGIRFEVYGRQAGFGTRFVSRRINQWEAVCNHAVQERESRHASSCAWEVANPRIEVGDVVSQNGASDRSEPVSDTGSPRQTSELVLKEIEERSCLQPADSFIPFMPTSFLSPERQLYHSVVIVIQRPDLWEVGNLWVLRFGKDFGLNAVRDEGIGITGHSDCKALPVTVGRQSDERQSRKNLGLMLGRHLYFLDQSKASSTPGQAAKVPSCDPTSWVAASETPSTASHQPRVRQVKNKTDGGSKGPNELNSWIDSGHPGLEDDGRNSEGNNSMDLNGGVSSSPTHTNNS